MEQLTDWVLINDALHPLFSCGGNHNGLRGTEKSTEYESYFYRVDVLEESQAMLLDCLQKRVRKGGIYIMFG